MQIDIDGTIGALLEWDLKLTIDGLTKSTRPVTLADVALLNRAIADPKSVDMLGLLCRLFEGSETEIRKWVEGWRPEKMGAAIQAITAYLTEVMRKKSPAIAAAMKATMAAAGANGPGISTP